MINRPENVVAGFRACGIIPFNKEAIPKDLLAVSMQFSTSRTTQPTGPSSTPQSTEPSSTPSTSGTQEILTPRKQWRESLIQSITPPQTAATKAMLEQQKAPRKRIQKKHGECLTEESAMERSSSSSRSTTTFTTTTLQTYNCIAKIDEPCRSYQTERVFSL